MRITSKLIIIARDGWPLEQIDNSPIKNFFRRLLFGHHKECSACWYAKRRQILADCGTNQVKEPR